MDDFDPKDPKFQVSSDFPPDKTETYPLGIEYDGWFLAHNGLRGEVLDFEQALTAVQQRFEEEPAAAPLPAWVIESMQQWYEQHYIHVSAHHRNEDEIVYGVAIERFHWPEKIGADHELLVEKLNEIKRLIESLQPQHAGGVSEILEHWNEYKKIMFSHLEEEEKMALPLLRAYFSKQEIQKRITKPIIDKAPKCELGAVLHYYLEPGCDVNDTQATSITGFRSYFMKREKIPFFIWHFVFQPSHRNYVKTIFCHVTALKTGEPPMPPPQRFSCWS